MKHGKRKRTKKKELKDEKIRLRAMRRAYAETILPRVGPTSGLSEGLI